MPPLRARRARSPPSPFPRRAAAPAARRLPRANWAPPAPVRAGGSPGARRRLARPPIPGRGARHRRSPRPGSRPLPRGGAVPAGAVEPQACRRGSPPCLRAPPSSPPRTAPARPSGRLPGQGPLDLVRLYTYRLYTYSPTTVGGSFFKHATMCQKKVLGEGVNYGGGPCTVFLPIQSGPPEAHKSVGRRDLVEFC